MPLEQDDTTNDELSAGFALSSGDAPKEPAPEPTPTPDAPENEQPTDEVTPGDSTPPAEAPSPTEPKDRENDPAYWRQRFSTTEGLLKKEREAREAAERRAAELAATPKPASTDAPSAEPDPGTPTDDDDPEWREVLESVPTIGAAIDKRVTKLVDKALAPLRPKVEKVESIARKVEEDEAAKHFRAIADVHSDWRELASSNEFNEWIGALGWKRPAAEAVMNNGTAREVIELLTEFKAATGRKPPLNPNPADDPRLHDAGGVRSQTTGPRSGVTPSAEAGKDDFGAGWKQSLNTT